MPQQVAPTGTAEAVGNSLGQVAKLEEFGALQAQLLNIDAELAQHEQSVNLKIEQLQAKYNFAGFQEEYAKVISEAELAATPVRKERARLMVKVAENDLCPTIVGQRFIQQAAMLSGQKLPSSDPAPDDAGEIPQDQ